MELIFAGRNEGRITDRFAPYKEESDYSFFKFDALLEVKEDVKADYFIHCASNASPAQFASEPVETLLMNISGVHDILKLAKNSGGRFLFVSSSEVYGNNESGKPYREEDYGFVDILNPRACYPSGKRAAETLCSAFSAEYGIETVVVRPGHIYGPQAVPSDNRAATEFIRLAASGQNIVMKSKGTQLRSYTYSLDCASAILSVLIKGKNGNAYNISNKDAIVTISDLATETAKAGGVELLYQEASDIEKKSYNLMSMSALDSEKIEGLGWKAVFDLKKGIRSSLECF
jgi:nucleoside-diphosphate-sugar epimerase